jgi:hypothetical protein
MPKLRKNDPKPIIYLSGGHTAATRKEEIRWIKTSRCKYRCYSFGYTCPGAFYYNKRMEKSLNISIGENVGIMMDSGAFSFHKFIDKATGGLGNKKRKFGPQDVERMKDEVIDQYTEYCKQNSKQWDFYVTFDYIKHAPTCYKIQQQLLKRGLDTVPVFHGDTDSKWFERYCQDGAALVGLGTGKVAARMSWRGMRHYFDDMFNIAAKYGTQIHGFAINSLSYMFEYPFYSVDATTWVKTSSFGKIVYIDSVSNTIGQIHISHEPTRHAPSYAQLSKAGQREMKRQIADDGFDFDLMRKDGHERSMYNAFVFNNKLMELKDDVAKRKIHWRPIIKV